MSDGFRIGKQRRFIEDSIVVRFRQVDFQEQQHGYLEKEPFWDYVFSWYELVKYYEESGDNTLGAHMLDLFAQCSHLFRQAASDPRLSERRRDKAADALYQITYYVNQIAIQVRRNGLEQESATGDIAWKPTQDSSLN
jgi:hypothetical protein